jgi:hypothetical protein
MSSYALVVSSDWLPVKAGVGKTGQSPFAYASRCHRHLPGTLARWWVELAVQAEVHIDLHGPAKHCST